VRKFKFLVPEIVLSIRPFYATQILEGKKTIELRRRFPVSSAQGAIALIYATAPVQAIVGQVKISSVELLPLSGLWKKARKLASIAKSDFDQYFDGLSSGYALHLESATEFSSPILATDLVNQFDFVPPQSFRYIGIKHEDLLRDERLQVSN